MAVHTAACFILFGAGVTGLGWEDSATAERGTWVAPVAGRRGLDGRHRCRLAEPGLDASRAGALSDAHRSAAPAHGDHRRLPRCRFGCSRRWRGDGACRFPPTSSGSSWRRPICGAPRAIRRSRSPTPTDASRGPLRSGIAPAAGLAGAARARAIEAAARTRSTALSPLVDSDSGRSIYIAVPVYRDGAYFGAAVGVFRLTDQLMSALGQDAANDYHVALFDGTTRVFGPAAEGDPSTAWGTSLGLRVREATWRLGVWPTGSRVDQLEGPLPSVLLAGGILLSALATAIVFVVDVRRRRERELKHTTEQLQEQDRQREAAQIALRASEERYRSLIDGAIDIIYRVDANGHFTFVNPVAARVMNREPSALLGCHFLDLVAPEAKAEVARFYAEQLASRVHDTYLEFPAIGGDGRTVWIGQNVQMLVEENGQYRLPGGRARHHRAQARRRRARRGARSGARNDAAEVAVRRQHEPRAADADERHSRLDGAAARDRAQLTSSATTRRPSARAARRCWRCSTTSSISRRSKPAAWSSHNEPFDIRHLIQQTADLVRGEGAAQGRRSRLRRAARCAAGRARRSGPRPAGADQPARQRRQVHRAPARSRCASALDERRRRRHAGAVRRDGHGHRHLTGVAGAAVPALRAGRWLDHPPLRRHRAGPGHLAAAVGADGRPP